MEETKIIEIEASTQDEAVKKSEEEAKAKGYRKVSVKEIISIKYKVLLYDKPAPEQPKQESEATQ